MHKWFSVLAVSTCLAASPALAFVGNEQSALKYVVKVEVGNEHGSGVVMPSDPKLGNVTLIVTCDHVIKEGKDEPVGFVSVVYDGKAYVGQVTKEDSAKDLALVMVPDLRLDSPEFGTGSLVPGEPELAVGAPFGLDVQIDEGFVAGLVHGDGIPGTLIQGSAASDPGKSGGGMFVYRDKQWELVGIETGIWIYQNQDYPNVSLAIPLDRLEKFLNEPAKPNA